MLKMKYSLSANSLYGNTPVVIDLPEKWKVHTCSYAGEKYPALSTEEIRATIRHAGMREKAEGCKTAVIIIDDMTRPTPCGDIAEVVIEELLLAGVPERGISFVGAVGMHRAMSREDFVRKLGEKLVRRFPTYSHNPFFNTVQLGICSHGIPIELNAECVRAEFKVGIGAMFGHPNTGISGGGKLIVPGISSAETIRRFHLTPREKWNMGLMARQITIEAAEMLGLDFKLDTLLNGEGKAAKLYVGDCRSNIEDHVEEIHSFFRAERPESADVVIANNYFKPSEANVVLNYPEFFELIRPGGDLIVSTHSPMGAATHYMFGKWGNSGIGGLGYHGESGVPECVGRYFAFSHYIDPGTSLQYHFSPDDPRFNWADNWEIIVEKIGDGEKDVLILPYAGVPYFDPPIDVGSVPTLFIGNDGFVKE